MNSSEEGENDVIKREESSYFPKDRKQLCKNVLWGHYDMISKSSKNEQETRESWSGRGKITCEPASKWGKIQQRREACTRAHNLSSLRVCCAHLCAGLRVLFPYKQGILPTKGLLWVGGLDSKWAGPFWSLAHVHSASWGLYEPKQSV